MLISTRMFPAVLGVLIAAPVLIAQTCSPLQFLNINQFKTGTGGNPPSGVALIRQPDGSYAGYRGTGRPPTFTFNSILPNYQQNLYACSALANRPHAAVPGRPNFLDVLLGLGGRNPLVVDLLGNSTSLSGIGADYLSNLQNGITLAVANLDGSLRSTTNYAAGTRPERMVAADFNGDTHRDIAIINAPFNGNGSISVYLGNGPGGGLAPAVNYPTGTFPVAITAADFNSDNRPDIAVIDQRAGNFNDRFISVYINNGNGTFRDPVSIFAPGAGLDLIAADVTGDGRVDLITGGSPIAVFPGNADGTFRTPLLSPVPVGSFYIAAGDFNKDGRIDLAASEGETRAITIHFNSGGGLFNTRRSYSIGDPNGLSEPHLIVTDFDGDTWPDIVVGSGHPDALLPNLYSQTILRVLINRADGSGAFFGAPTFPGGSQLLYPAIADFNLDGKADAVTSSNTGIAFLAGTGAGFQGPVTNPIRTHQNFNQGAQAVAAGDFNGDGKPDIAAYNGSIAIALGNGNGSFTQSVNPIAVTGTIAAFATGDLNNDGKVDLVAGLTSNGTPKPTQVLILLGNGNGTFQNPTPFTVCSNPTYLRLAQLNADTNLDLVATCSGTLFNVADGGGVGVALGNGDGTFQATTVLPAGVNPTFTAIADVTGDNRPELFSSVSIAGELGAYRIAVHLNQGNGVFQAPSLLNTDFGPSGLAVMDFTGDGNADILAGHCCGDTDIGLYVGNGNGTFQGETETRLGEATHLIPGDFNNDGKTDLLTTRSANNALTVFFNLTGTLPVEACTFTLSHTSLVAASAGDAFGVVVRPSNPNCTWTASATDPWITVPGAQRTGPGTAFLRIATNDTAAFRTGSATVAGLPVSITQYPTIAGCTFSLSPSSFSFNGESRFESITVTTGNGCQWTSRSSAQWLSGTASGTGTNAFASLNASQNGTGAARAAVFDVGGARIQVIQRPLNATQVFGDVTLADPFYGHISLMRDRTITSGCTTTNYCPSDITNRGQMAVFLIRAILGTENFNFPAAPFFTDVPANHPFFRYIQKLRELNVTTGCTATTYCPDDPVTRGQMAAFLVRASLGIAPGDTFPFPAGAFFTDVPVNHPFYSFVQLMRVRGITSGCTANTYCPDDPVTRGQMAVFLVRGLIAP